MASKKVAIIGAGPTGIASAIQLKRYKFEPILLEMDEIGGLLRNANLVENYPGFPSGIKGMELVALFKKHLDNAGVEVAFERVMELKYDRNTFIMETDVREIESDVVVIASGTKPKKIPALPIREEVKSRVFYEVHPLLETYGRRIAIIGAGDAAFDYALNLSARNDVIILNRSSRPKCIPLLLERSMKSESISYMSDVLVKEVDDRDGRLSLTCRRSSNGRDDNITADLLVIAVGREPNLDFMSIEPDDRCRDLIKTNSLYIVGDTRNDIYRQTAICVGDGIKTAMQIYRDGAEGEV